MHTNEVKSQINKSVIRLVENIRDCESASFSLAHKKSRWQKIGTSYRKTIESLVLYLTKYCFRLAAVLGTLLTEPWSAIKAACRFPFNWRNHFNYHDLNPKTLTIEQAKKHPILLIHGDFHNQSAWLTLAKKLKYAGLGPVYTINLPSGEVTQYDYALILQKITEIKAQYSQQGIKKIKVNIVGHSRGGYLAHHSAWSILSSKMSEDHFGKIISLGSVLNNAELHSLKEHDSDFENKKFEITAAYDVLETAISLLPPQNQMIINTGHLGLLYSNDVHQRIIQLLKA